jgi:hypothetical protein
MFVLLAVVFAGGFYEQQAIYADDREFSNAVPDPDSH